MVWQMDWWTAQDTGCGFTQFIFPKDAGKNVQMSDFVECKCEVCARYHVA